MYRSKIIKRQFLPYSFTMLLGWPKTSFRKTKTYFLANTIYDFFYAFYAFTCMRACVCVNVHITKIHYREWSDVIN